MQPLRVLIANMIERYSVNLNITPKVPERVRHSRISNEDAGTRVTLMPQQDRHSLNPYQASLSGNWFGYVPGNQATLLHNGEAYFTAIETAIDRARHDIYLQTYIYENDATGQRIGDALKRAASRGVKVYVLIDGYGSQNLPRSMVDRLKHRFNASVAEVGSNYNWQRIELGISTVGNDRRHVESSLGNILSFVDSLYLAEIVNTESEILNL